MTAPQATTVTAIASAPIQANAPWAAWTICRSSTPSTLGRLASTRALARTTLKPIA